jgi:hypothetical protein
MAVIDNSVSVGVVVLSVGVTVLCQVQKECVWAEIHLGKIST